MKPRTPELAFMVNYQKLEVGLRPDVRERIVELGHTLDMTPSEIMRRIIHRALGATAPEPKPKANRVAVTIKCPACDKKIAGQGWPAHAVACAMVAGLSRADFHALTCEEGQGRLQRAGFLEN